MTFLTAEIAALRCLYHLVTARESAATQCCNTAGFVACLVDRLMALFIGAVERQGSPVTNAGLGAAATAAEHWLVSSIVSVLQTLAASPDGASVRNLKACVFLCCLKSCVFLGAHIESLCLPFDAAASLYCHRYRLLCG